MLFERSLLAVLAIALMAVFSHAEVTYTLHKSANPTADEQDAYKRITIVMDSAVKLYNTYSNLSKFINVYYAPGVPTAEASSNGDLRFGENRSYMVVPTAMHEMGHTMGIGTTQEYWDVCKDGVFRNDKVQAKLRELDNDPTKELHCDSQHIWPYGLNQASEAKSEKDLINHVILVETIYQQLFKVAFFKEGRIKSLSERKCMGITADNALELMDCSDKATFVKIFSVGDNPVTYYVQLGSRVIDIPNESTAAGVKASTYGYNGGAHQRYVFEDAGVNTPLTFFFKNSKSGHYLQAVGNTVVQNPKQKSEAFMWKIEEDRADTSKVEPPDTSVVDTGKTDSTGDTSSVKIVRLRDTRVDLTPARTFDLKGRSIGRQPLGRSRNTHKVLFKK
ncbi:MAG: RICIN domain-containing protein [Fibrobacter sp.]|nr:RICIN domain-containing protein [Fibrobacter sp.]MBR6853837.1 RICIN domain-containing protein [Fibrobacter sp.]